MSPELVNRISGDVLKVLAMPDVRQKIAGMTGDVLAGTPAEFGKLVSGETAKWRDVVRQAKISAN